jgi:Flp pilus assembly protein TadG
MLLSAVARPQRRYASAAVELAIVVPVLAVLVIGMVEITRAIQVKSYLTDTARSACRLAIQNGSTNASVTSNVNTILTDNGINANLATVTILVNGNSMDVSAAKKYDQVSIKIAVPIGQVNWFTPYFWPNSAVESETLVMVHQ